MLPMVGVPETIRKGLRPYRDLFGRAEGFEHMSRYVTGLLVSPNKTLQGIYAGQVWEGEKPSRRAMHEAVFEAGWEAEKLLRGKDEATRATIYKCAFGKDVLLLGTMYGKNIRVLSPWGQ